MTVDNNVRTIYRNSTIKQGRVTTDPTLYARPYVPMDTTDLTAIDAARMCKALGHPARLGILRQLLREERCVCGRIVEVLPLAQSTVSQHLKVLKDAGLIIGEVEGPRTCYCADRQRLAALAAALSAMLSPCREEQR